jgi:uncharacterized protein YhaN
MFDFPGIKKSINDLSAQLQKIRREIEEKKQRHEDLETLAIGRDEAAARLAAWVDAGIQQAATDLQTSLGFVIANPLMELKADTRISLLSSPQDASGGVRQHMLFLFFADAIKTAIPGVLVRLEWPEDTGPPMAERLAELGKLDKAIEKLEREEADLIQQAAQAGISVAPLGGPSTDKRNRPHG